MDFDALDHGDDLDLKQLNDLDIEDEDRRQFTGRNNDHRSFDDQQSYFTSRVGESSSETIDSDLILAYQ